MVVIFIDEATGIRRSVKGDVGSSLLSLALGSGVNIEHTCGGVAACSTCHVLIVAGEAYLSEPADAELDQLDLVPNRRLQSRLACQAIISGEGTIEVAIPKWNRNAVEERRPG